MCARATLAMATSSTCMKVAIEITPTISHGLRSPAAERSAFQPPPAPADASAISAPARWG